MPKPRIAALFLAVTVALAAPGANALYINSEAFRATGGDPNNLAATANAGMEPRRQRSRQAPFDAVGLTQGCTGTVLGTDASHAWVLTAAHCVGAGWRQYSISTPTISASGWSRVYHPPGYAGGIAWDVALVSIPLAVPVSPAWNALTKPLLYDGSDEIGRIVHMVGYGLTAVGQTEVWIPDRRLWGTTKIVGAFANNTGLVSGYAAHGHTDLQVRGAPGDSGSAAWQQHAGGYWTIIGVTATVGANGTNYTRVNRHVDWIKGVFPGASSFSERLTVTHARPLVTRNHAEDVDHGTVYYVVAPGQAGVSGPTSRIWNGDVGAHSTISVTAKDAITGSERPVVLRASRDTGCGVVRMENGVICYSARMGPLKVSYHAQDNAGLPSGEWKAKFDVSAIGWHRPYNERLPISVDVRNLVEGRVTKTASWRSPNFAAAASRGTVYYVVPLQAGAAGPTSRIWSGERTHSTIRVLAKEASTGFERQVVLRAHRENGCGGPRRMEDGVMCYDMKMGPLTVLFHAADNADLPAGTWRGAAYVRAKGWHDHAVDEAIRLDVDIQQ